MILYVERRGPLMAAGLAYRLFFAIAALLVVAFAGLGIVLAGDDDLRELSVGALDRGVPGLIDTAGLKNVQSRSLAFNASSTFFMPFGSPVWNCFV